MAEVDGRVDFRRFSRVRSPASKTSDFAVPDDSAGIKRIDDAFRNPRWRLLEASPVANSLRASTSERQQVFLIDQQQIKIKQNQ